MRSNLCPAIFSKLKHIPRVRKYARENRSDNKISRASVEGDAQKEAANRLTSWVRLVLNSKTHSEGTKTVLKAVLRYGRWG